MITEEEALSRLTASCATTEYCKSDLSDKMQRWGIAYDAIERVIERLEKEKYIDEERYCRAYINDKFRFAKWGKMKISQSLYLKRISKDLVIKYLSEINREEYLETLSKLLAVKRKSIRANDDYERNNKLIRFAMSRGFEISDIKCCITDCDFED